MKKPSTSIKTIGLIALLTFLYFVTGKIGLMLAIPPGYATIIWPPSGIAVGMLLVFGFEIWPGVLIGSFLLNAHIAGILSGSHTFSLAQLAVPLSIAIGSTLQAILGKLLIEKSLVVPIEISTPKNLIKLFFIITPLFCLTAATIGTFSLYYVGSIAFENFFTNWLNWWLGDVFGAVVFLPLVLVLPVKNNLLSWYGKKLNALPSIATLLIVAALGLTFYGWKTASENYYEKGQSDFKNLIQENERALHARLDSYRHALLGGAGFLQGSTHVSREEWREYTDNININQNFPGMMGMGFIENVSPNNLNQFINEARDDHFPDFRIYPKTDQTIPYYVIKYVEPENLNRKALGLNIAFEQKRLKAATTSLETGLDVITRPINLIQDSEKTPGFLLLHPYYKKNITIQTIEDRRQSLAGWIYAPLVAKQFLDHLTASQGNDFNISIYDGETESPDNLIYSSRIQNNFPKHPSRFVEKKALAIMQEKWLIVWESSSVFDRTKESIAPQIILIGGLFFNLLLAIFLFTTLTKDEDTLKVKRQWRLAIPWLIFFITTLITIAVYNSFGIKEANVIKNLVELESKKFNHLLRLTATDKMQALKRMAQRWETSEGTPFKNWRADAENYVSSIEGLKAIEWIDTNYQIKWVEPLKGNESIINFNILSNEKEKQSLGNSTEYDSITLTPPFDLKQGYKGFVARAPIHIHNNFSGFIAGVFSVNTFFHSIIDKENLNNFIIWIKDNDGDVFFTNQDEQQNIDPQWSNEFSFEFLNQKWTIVINPNQQFIQQHFSSIPKIILISGLLISFLLSLSAHYIILSQIKSRNLRISEERHRLLVDGAKDYGIYMLDPKGHVSSWNSGAELVKGYKAEEIIGKHFSVFYTPEDQKNNLPNQILEKTLADGKYENTSCWRVRKDGTHFIAHVVIDPIFTASGELLGFAKITRDVTEKQAQELKLKELSSRLELATKSARIGVWDWNIVTNELIWDDMMLSLYGISRDEFTGAYEAWEKGVYFADKEAATLALQNAVAGKEKFDTTFRVIWPDKSIHYIRAMANVVFDENGKALKMVGVNWDITQQKDIDRMKNEFVSTVSHELRTPLTSIRGSLGLIAGKAAGELPAKMQPLVQIALSNCERLIRLINDILDVEKIESGKMEFKMKPANLIDVVKKSIAENENYAKQFDVNVNLTLQDENPIFANIDADKITQVITNLLSNAVKFSPKNGLVTVQVSTHDQRVRVAIIDQGGGIPEAFRSKIFSKFAQADSSDTKQKGGTGLGLSICKSLVHEHGGHIAFDSTLGKGSTFYFEIPVITSHAKSFIEKTHLESQRFLVCEDDPDIATLLRVILQDEGFTVDVAIDAAHAKKMILEHSYTGMTLDIMLPDKDGLSLLHELREIEKTKDLPVIIVSVKELSEHDKKKTMSDLNVHGWIPKPINVDNLLQNITQVSHTQKNNIKRVLHIEDDDDILDVVKQILIDVADVDFAKSCHEANNKLAKNKYDLILLDLLLPDGSGLSLLPPLNQTPGEYNIVIFSSHDVSVAPQANIAAVLLKSTTTNTKLKSTIQSLLENNTKKEV